MNPTRPKIYLYTDGASSGNPGPGQPSFMALTTYAVILGLEAVRWQNADIEVWSDSSYVVKAINEGWLRNWERKRFAKVKNPDLWMRFLAVYRRHHVTFHWLKGHAGHPENERCDQLAVNAGAGAVARGENLPEDTGFEENSVQNLPGME